MALKQFRLRDVFTPGGMPSVTYVERNGLGLESSLRDAIDRGHALITVSGPTKSGKLSFAVPSLKVVAAFGLRVDVYGMKRIFGPLSPIISALQVTKLQKLKAQLGEQHQRLLRETQVCQELPVSRAIFLFQKTNRIQQKILPRVFLKSEMNASNDALKLIPK